MEAKKSLMQDERGNEMIFSSYERVLVLWSLCLDPEKKKAMATRPRRRYLMLYLKIDSKRIMSMMGRQSLIKIPK